MTAIEEGLRKVLVDHVGVEESAITRETSFERDLGVDELDTVELVMAFEESLGAELPPAVAESIDTFGDAVDAFSKALHPGSTGADTSSPPGATAQGADALCDQATELIAEWMWSEAIEVLLRALGEAPRMTRCHHLLGRSYAGAGDRDQAIEHYLIAWNGAIDDDLQGPPRIDGFVSMTQGLTQELIGTGRSAEAIPIAERTLAIAPSSPDLLYNLACAHAQLGEGEACAGAMERAFALDPDQVEDARGDSDFDPVRDHPAMQSLFGR